ncbi:ComF family protein [Ureibacillus sp. MALMAid1270]|uniref:ComF family protein n=1 Tax=Ureibacillus sp. MALMAid1270 TaxID=3411629 RepID=UPI003BA4B34D
MKKEVYNCLLCGTPLNVQVTWKWLLGNAFERTICLQCEGEFESVDLGAETNKTFDVVSLYQYNDKMKDYLHRYKFMHDVALAKVFRNQIRQHLSKRNEIIVPIPMHPSKLKERTFAHVDELLKAANIPYQHFLVKTTTETQGEKTREERINSPQLFERIENVDVKNKEVLLVDDITTTGTTIEHARKALIEAGAKSVRAFTVIKG